MNVLSLCDGMCCGHIALDKIGIKIDSYYASEIKKEAINATTINFPDVIQIGDVNEVYYENGTLYTENGNFNVKFDLVIFGSPCFAKGTLVLTDKGFKPIEEITIGDLVLSHDNKYHRVTNAIMNGIKQIYSIKCQGSELIKTTNNHLFYVRENKTKKIYTKENKGQILREFGTPEWKSIESLMNTNYKKYYVGYAINQNSKLPEWNGITLYKYHKPYISNNLPLDNKDFWYIMGRFIGDGWICKSYKKGKSRSKYSGIRICCNEFKLPFLKESIEKLFHCNIVKERTVYKLQISNAELGHFCEQFGKGASNKEIPGFVLDLPIELLKSFLNGYFDSDGNYVEERDTLQFTTVSRKLAYGLSQCIMKVYHRPVQFTFHKRPKTYIIEGREVNQKDTYIVRFIKHTNPNKTLAFYEDGYLWCPIKKIESTNFFEEVYDLTVEDSHSFTANGVIVHNCQSFSKAMKTDMRTGLEDHVRSGLFKECYRVLKEVNPKYFLMENVIMDDYSRDYISSLLGVQPIRINSSLVSAQIRDRYYWTNIPDVTIPEDKHIKLQDILKDGYTEREKARCLMANDSHGYFNGCNWNAPARFHRSNNKAFSTMIYPDRKTYEICIEKGKELCNGRPSRAEYFNTYEGHEFDTMRYLWKEERARLQTVPEKYVECMSEKDAANLLGDGWTVDVIAHIFKGLKKDENS